jgi:hypothetical protein
MTLGNNVTPSRWTVAALGMLMLLCGALAAGCRQGTTGSAPPAASSANTAPPVTAAAASESARPGGQDGEGSTPGADRRVAIDRYDLGPDEQRGGHTLARHIGRTDEQLRERLRRETQIVAASTYTDRAIAERVVARALAANRPQVDAWLGRQGDRPNLVLDYHSPDPEPIGRSIERGSRTALKCEDALIVLRWGGGTTFYVLTTYPMAAS